MNIEFSNEGREDFLHLEKQHQIFFKRHMEKLLAMPPRRHLQRGIPYHVENVTKQARLVYDIQGETLYVNRCFATHEEYERWFKSFK
ncbi:MAG: hypothetical protein V1811_02130 [Candidatus Micrarchaeota archaeon]